MKKKLLLCGVVLGLAATLGGCMNLFTTRRYERSSSVADYLFPKEQRAVTPSMPVLQLPLRVGVAFAPSSDRGRGDFSELQKQGLLERVASTFRGQKIVDTVEVIPSTYLRVGGSFDNLDQIKRMMNIDVIILLSYDQLQFTSDKLSSLAYWTIVGAYVVHGNKNDTHTMVEAVVYDIDSRSLLFRAPGSDQTRRGATAFNLDEYQRRDSAHSLEVATDELIKNLSVELGTFKERVKQGTANVKIEHRAGYSGGGASEGYFLLLIAGALGLGALRKRRV